jgi:hypothetical protein
MQQVESYAAEHGYGRLFLSTTPFLDGAIALYESTGFRRTNEGPHDLYGTPLFTMEKRLDVAGTKSSHKGAVERRQLTEWECLSIQGQAATVVFREVASHSYALASVVEPHEQPDSPSECLYALGEGSCSAAQPLEVVTQVGVEAFYRVRLLFGFGDDVRRALWPQQVRVDGRSVSAVMLGSRQSVYHLLHVLPA